MRTGTSALQHKPFVFLRFSRTMALAACGGTGLDDPDEIPARLESNHLGGVDARPAGRFRHRRHRPPRAGPGLRGEPLARRPPRDRADPNRHTPRTTPPAATTCCTPGCWNSSAAPPRRPAVYAAWQDRDALFRDYILWSRAQALVAAGVDAGARQCLYELVRALPDSPWAPDAHFQLAASYADAGKLDLAQQTFQSYILKQKKRRQEARLRVARIHLARQDWAAAGALLQELLGCGESRTEAAAAAAITDQPRLLASAQASEPRLAALVRVLIENREVTRAQPLVAELQQRFPASTRQPLYQFWRGRCFFLKGDYPAALTWFQQAAAGSDQGIATQSRFAMARALTLAGREAEAVPIYTAPAGGGRLRPGPGRRAAGALQHRPPDRPQRRRPRLAGPGRPHPARDGPPRVFLPPGPAGPAAGPAPAGRPAAGGAGAQAAARRRRRPARPVRGDLLPRPGPRRRRRRRAGAGGLDLRRLPLGQLLQLPVHGPGPPDPDPAAAAGRTPRRRGPAALRRVLRRRGRDRRLPGALPPPLPDRRRGRLAGGRGPSCPSSRPAWPSWRRWRPCPTASCPSRPGRR